MSAPTASGKLSLDSLAAKVADEFTERRARGERPTAEEYAARYPEHAEVLREVLAALELVNLSLSAGAAADVSAGGATGTLGDYRIVREVGRGGMGVVYEAEQISLGRRVALKVLPFAATMDPRQLQRFQNEARAAACLHHEHIVPVHGVGSDRGVYYYAMQFIDGRTLAALIEDRRGWSSADAKTTAFSPSAAAPETPPVAALTTEDGPSDAGYFRRVAQWGTEAALALEHAHEHGIVHRDIKPGNLMIDGHGKLWVTDFGLARTASDSGLTLTGDMLGTLRYMSPEQAQAKHGLVDHRTDVYSLGVTLYELLTLRPAFAGSDRADLLRQVAYDEPPPPRRFNRSVPADLETVVLKAMAKEPAERYATAAELADDLRRYLDDKPVLARRPTLGQRLTKWSRRHRGLVRGSLVMLLLAVVGLAVAAWLIWEARDAADTARVAADTARDAAEQKRRLSDDNLEIADKVLDQIYLAMAEKDAARDPQWDELLQKALQFYLRFAETNAVDPAVRFKAGKAYGRAGRILKSLGQDEEAERAFCKGIDLLGQVPADSPQWSNARQQLASVSNELGLLLRMGDHFAEAEKALRRAVEVHEVLLAGAPNNDVYQHALAVSTGNLAVLFRLVGRSKEAEQLLQRSLTLHEKSVREFPKHPLHHNGLSGALAELAQGLMERSGLEGALELQRRAVRHQLEAVKLAPRDSYHQLHLCNRYYILSVILREMRRYDEALQAGKQHRELAARLVQEFPRIPECANLLASSHHERAEALDGAGRAAEAKAARLEAENLLGELVQRYQHVTYYRRNLANFQVRRAELFGKIGQFPEAAAAYRAALDLWKGQPKVRQNLASYRRETAEISLKLGALLTDDALFADSEQALQRAATLYQELTREFPNVAGYRLGLARSYQALVILFSRSRQPEKAEGAFGKALPMLRQLVKDFAGVSDYRGDLAATLNTWANHLRKASRFDEAERTFLEVLDLHGGATDRRYVAISHYNLGLVYSSAKRWPEAEEAYRKARAIQEKLIAETPNIPALHEELARTTNNQGMLRREAKDLAGARARCEESRRHSREALKPNREIYTYRRALGQACLNLADVLVKLKDHVALAEVATEFAGLDWEGLAQSAELFIDCATLVGKNTALARAHADRATEVLRKAAEACPNSTRERLFLLQQLDPAAERLDRGGWKEQAAAALRLCIDAASADPEVGKNIKQYPVWLTRKYTRLCIVLRESGQKAEALAAYREAAAAVEKLAGEHPEELAIQADLGLILNDLTFMLRERSAPAVEQRTLLEKAIRCFENVLKVDPGDKNSRQNLSQAHANLAAALLDLGDHAAAARAADDVARTSSRWITTRAAAMILSACLPLLAEDTRLGEQERTALTQKYLARARALVLDAVRVLPDTPAALDDMARFLVISQEPRLHEPALALKLAARATQREPLRARAWATVGLAQYRLGDDRAAIAALERAVRLGVDEYTPAEFVLAMARWRNGELMAARFDYWRGVKRLAGARPENTLLPRFREEAARVLRLPKDQQ